MTNAQSDGSGPRHARSAKQSSAEPFRQQARALLRRAKSGDPAEQQRLRSASPPGFDDRRPRLSDALHVIAIEQGFTSRRDYSAYIRAGDGARRDRMHATETDRQWYADRALGLLSQFESQLPAVAERQIGRFHPGFLGQGNDAIFSSRFTLGDARLVTAREHGLTSWRALKRHLAAIASGQRTDPFHCAFRAMKSGDLDALGDWIERDASLIHARGSNGNTLLNLAVGTNNPEAVALLISLGADIEADNVRGWTPLHSASSRPELIRVLIAAGARGDRSALGDGGTPLAMALFWGHRESAELLASEYGVLPRNLRAAAGVGDLSAIAAMFGSDGALTAEAGSGRAFYRPHSGFPVWHPSNDPQEIIDEAFVYAARNLRIDAMEALLSRGAEIDSAPYRGSALHWVAAKASPSPDPAGENALQLKTAQWLLAHGADVNLRSGFGGPAHGREATPLHLAAQNGKTKMAELLLSAGADTAVRDGVYDSTASGWAGYFGHAETAGVIDSYGANLRNRTHP